VVPLEVAASISSLPHVDTEVHDGVERFMFLSIKGFKNERE